MCALADRRVAVAGLLLGLVPVAALVRHVDLRTEAIPVLPAASVAKRTEDVLSGRFYVDAGGDEEDGTAGGMLCWEGVVWDRSCAAGHHGWLSHGYDASLGHPQTARTCRIVLILHG